MEQGAQGRADESPVIRRNTNGEWNPLQNSVQPDGELVCGWLVCGVLEPNNVCVRLVINERREQQVKPRRLGAKQH